MRPLFVRVRPFVDCLSTETFFKRLTGRSTSAVLGEMMEISPSAATKLTWYGASTGLLEGFIERMKALLAEQNVDVASLTGKRTSLISGFLSTLPRVGETPWTAITQQYFNDLAELEANLHDAAANKDLPRMQAALGESGVSRYVKMVPATGYADWTTLNSIEDFRREGASYSRLLCLIGIALLDHELRVAVWPEHEPRTVFAPLLPQYRLAPDGSIKGLPVRPERRLLDVIYFARTGQDAPPTDKELFPTNTESMAKKVQRATLSAADCYAAARDWTRLPEPSSVGADLGSIDEKAVAKANIVFDAYYFSSKAFGYLFDRTSPKMRHQTIPEMQKNYYIVWKSIRLASPLFSSGSCAWEWSRFERLIRDEIRITK